MEPVTRGRFSPQAKAAFARYQHRKRLTGGWRVDPTPGPYPGGGPIRFRPYETPEQRAFRRFPIAGHKPRWG